MSDDRLEQLVRRYAGSLTERLVSMEDRLDRLDEIHDMGGDWRQAEDFETLRRDIHQLAGSAGSMGFQPLGRAASALDVHLQALAERPQSPRPLDWRQVQALFARLRTRILHVDPAASRLFQRSRIRPPASAAPCDQRCIVLASADVGLADLLGRELRPFGMTLRLCNDAEALATALDAEEAVAVLDDRAAPLPDLDCAAAVRATGRSLPVLAVEIDGSLPRRVAAHRAGAAGYLIKPLDAAEVVDAVERAQPAADREKPRVLLVDDDEAMLALIDYALTSGGMRCHPLSDPALVLKAVAEFRPDVIVVDLMMPDYDGFAIVAAIRQQPVYTSVPVVFLTRDASIDSRLEGMALGGDDYIVKPVDIDQFASLVQSRVMRARQVRALITRDGLTGLLNHVSFRDELEREIATARRTGRPLSVAMVDVDHFKMVNDTHGHPVGDQVLQSLARLLRQRLRRTDTPGRIGGEEFAAILPGADGAQAVQVIEALLVAFREVSHHGGENGFSVTFSAGVATLGDGMDASALIRCADEALYDAKASGRNRVAAASEA